MKKYFRNRQIIDGELDNNQIMMHLEKGKYYGLNPVGKRIWDIIDEPKSFHEIINILLSDFDITKEQCIKEVQAFLDKAGQYDIIKNEVNS